MRSIWITTILCACAAGQAQAADIVQQIRQCQTVTQEQERLRCYDQLAQQIPASAPAAATTVTTQAAGQIAAKTPTEAFGLETRVDDNQLEQLQLTVKSVRQTTKRRLQITMDNGQVWQQTDDSSLDVKPGDQCRVERAFMGSFLLSNGRSNLKIRVRRVD